MNCCDDYGNCNQGRDCPVRASRRIKAYPHVPTDEVVVKAIEAWVSLDKKLAWASWALVATTFRLLLLCLVILSLELV